MSNILKKIAPHSYNIEFRNLLNSIEKKFGWELFNLSGIGNQLDANKFGKDFFKSDVTADASVDPNSNVSDKSVVAYHFEASKPMETINALYRLWKGLIKHKRNEGILSEEGILLFANNVIKMQISGDIYINDITGLSTNRSYCYNYCTLDVATRGLPKEFDGEGVAPPKHLSTFFSQLLDFMIYAGNSTLGAVGIADALITTTCFFKKVLKQCGDDNTNFISEEDCWKYLGAKFEKFLYDINKPNRANQSLFSNLSIYDDAFLKDLCPNYVVEIDGEIYQADVELVKKVQQVFIDTYNKEQKRRLMTFPVLTPCFALDSDKNLVDETFLRQQVKNNRDFKMMNFYGGETSTLSSCCFDGDTEVLVLEFDDTLDIKVEKYITLRDLYLSGENKSYYILQQNTFQPCKPVRLPVEDKVMFKITMDDDRLTEIICTEDHIFPVFGKDILARDLKQGDKLTKFFPTRGCENFAIKEIEIIKNYDKEYVYCVNMFNEQRPYFTLANGYHVGNCRLRSKKDAKYMNTIGSGGVRIGSIGVCTINLSRLAKKHSSNLDSFYDELENLVEVCQTVNYVKRKNIKRAISQGRIPLYSHGFININTQYNTVGAIGFNEACKNLGHSILSEKGQEIVLKMMNTMNDKNDEMSDKFETPTNLEQIPGENVAVKLARKDKLLGLNDEFEMYSNQFIPLSSEANMFDRIDLQAKFDEHFGGGSILHINIDELDLDDDIYFELLKIIFKKGVIYVAFNNIIGVCNDCGQNTVQNKEDISIDNTGICKKCDSKNVDVALRIVGFIRKVKNWVKERRKEFHNRQFYNIGDEQ